MLPKKFSRQCATGALVTVILCASTQSAAAEVTIDEIIVTADFRGRSASTLPTSITVLDRETIEQAAVQHFEELVFIVPNFNWSGDGNRARYFQIRGVGELEQYEGAPNPSVGFLIDDIDFSGIGTIATLYDVQQVEVLRGPQGTRYGANAIGGLVYVQSTEPGDEWSGNLRIGAADDNAFAGGLAFGGPVSSSGTTSFRLSAHHYQSDGFRRNAFLGRDDTNGRHETTVRGKVLWEPDSAWTFKLSALYTDIDDGYDAFAINNTFTVLSDKPGRDAQESIGASFKAVWQGSEDLELTSITSFANSDIDFSFDADWGNPVDWAPFTYDFISLNDRNRSTLSQEFRLAFDNWLIGLYVMRLDDDLQTLNQGSYYDPFADFTLDLDDPLSSAYEATNSSLFGEFDVELGKSGRISIGLRLENRSTDYADSSGMSQNPGEWMSGGNVTYSHELSDTATGYVRVSKGYKAGGFNLGPVPPGQRREFDKESIWNVEAGMKSHFLNGTLLLNTSIFYNKRYEQQVRPSYQVVPNDPASFIFFTVNAPKARTLGFEAELSWRPNDAWQVYANLGLLEAEFDHFVTPKADLSGRRLAHAPDYTVALGGIYRDASGYFARLDFAVRDDFYFDVSHDQKSRETRLVNSRIGYETDHWSAQLWARNVLDEHYPVRGFYFGNEPPDFPNELYVRFGDRRQIGITFDIRF